MQSAAGSPLEYRARRRARSKTLQDFQLRTQEKFLYPCGAIDLWEWEVRLLDSEQGAGGGSRRARRNVTHPYDAKWTGSANRKAYSILMRWTAVIGEGINSLIYQRVGTVNGANRWKFHKMIGVYLKVTQISPFITLLGYGFNSVCFRRNKTVGTL